MPVTVGANAKSVVHKSSSGVTIAFPDVCHIPAPPTGPLPIPYPSFAKTATAAQQRRKAVASTPTAVARSAGDEAGVMSEVGTLKAKLTQLNTRLQSLPAFDPNQWQAVLQEYAVLASALYLTQKKD